MFLRIETLPEKKLIGKHLRMSLTDNYTPQLWRSFMVSRRSITNSIGIDLYSIQVYDNAHYFRDLDINTQFEKWAAIEVADQHNIPVGFVAFTLAGGLYAIFLHKGLPSAFQATFQYIFGSWLPTSGYELDHRPHFELLGDKYINNDPASEEEIWVPVTHKDTTKHIKI